MKKSLFLLNVIAPILLGAILYYLFFPETLFVECIDNVFGVSYHIPVVIDNMMIKLIRFYLLDFLWSYALMSTIVICFDNDKKIILIVVIFEVLLEAAQILPFVKGTFDVCDIGVEIMANILVIYLSRRRLENEKT